MVYQEVARHASHPRCKSAVRRSVARQRAVHPKEHILRQVLGFRPVACEPIADIEYAARVATHKFLPGRAVSLEALLDQLGILLQRKISLASSKACRKAPERPLAGLHVRRLPLLPLAPFERPLEWPMDWPLGRLRRPATVWNVNCHRIVPLVKLATDIPFGLA